MCGCNKPVINVPSAPVEPIREDQPVPQPEPQPAR